ncbi:STAS domain-containing protein [Planctomicrobium sp. SH664]|uniref:STAS domain-containing protein n=1 Tax=Planctomicrobium sp. SH664 TaxID=3448125 RepID=UPI003F5BD0B2
MTEASWSEIEAFGADVKAELESRTRPACLVDLTPLDYMGSSIVALIVRVWKVVQSRQGKMVVVCTHPMVLEVLRLAGLDKVWKIETNLERGVEALGIQSGDDAILKSRKVVKATTRVRRWSYLSGVLTVLVAIGGAWVLIQYTSLGERLNKDEPIAKDATIVTPTAEPAAATAHSLLSEEPAKPAANEQTPAVSKQKE